MNDYCPKYTARTCKFACDLDMASEFDRVTQGGKNPAQDYINYHCHCKEGNGCWLNPPKGPM